MNYSIQHDLIIEASRQSVFDAFCLPEHLNNWWTLKSSGQPIFGAEYNLNFTDKYNWYCKVSKVELNESFYLKMIKSDEDWNPTTFGIQLSDTENGTLVEFSHTGWENNNHEFRHSSFCWALLLKGLKNYLEKGIILPFEERD